MEYAFQEMMEKHGGVTLHQLMYQAELGWKEATGTLFFNVTVKIFTRQKHNLTHPGHPRLGGQGVGRTLNKLEQLERLRSEDTILL